MGFSKNKQTSQNSSQQTSQSSNQSYPFLVNALGDQVSNVGQGSKAIADLLGLNGSANGFAAFDQFKNSSGYNFIKDEGIRNINANKASRGLLRSGSALKAITDYSSGLASSFLDNYLTRLAGLSNTGLQAGQLISSAGNVSTSQGTSSGTSSGNSSSFSFG
jgi:hypothetical protein